jgi:hypothetical protein
MRGSMNRLCALVLVVATHAIADDWKEVQDTDGVKVYSRALPDRAIRSVKGTGIVDAPVMKVALVLLDDDRAPEWVDSLAEARVVRRVGPGEYIEYNHVKMPFIVSDREFVTNVTMSVDREKRVVVMRSVPAAESEVKKTPAWVRGELSALYVLESIDEGKRTRLTVEVDADPRGALPPFIVNFFQKDWSRDTIKGIRSQAKKPDLKPPEAFAEFLATVDF